MDPTPVINGIDLNHSAKLQEKTLSSEPERRVKIIQVWKETIEERDDCLTPRSQNNISESIETKLSTYFNEIKTSEYELRQFISSFPKGGDTHCHLTGVMDSIEYLKWAVKNDLELSLEGRRVKASKIKEDPQLECVFFENTTLPYKTANPNKLFFDKFDNSEIIDPYLVLSTHLCSLLEEAVEHNILYIETSKGFETHLKKWNEEGKKEYLQDFPENELFENKLKENHEELEYVRLLKRKLEILLNHPTFKQKKEHYIKYIDEADKSEVITNKLKKKGFKDSLFSLENPVVLRLNGDVSRELRLPEFFADLTLAFLIANEESKRPNPRVFGVVISGRECTTQSFNERKAQLKILGFLRSQYPKVHCSPHAGELCTENVDIKYMRHAIHYPIKYADPSRLGHATCIVFGMTKNLDHVFTRLKDKEKPICIEICLTSNEKILKIKNSQHPLPVLLTQGIPVTLNTDDPGVLLTNITDEFIKAIQRYSEYIDYVTLKNLARNQIRYSFLPGEEIYENSSPYQYKLRNCFEEIIKKSPKAFLQYRLEKDFLQFEKNFEGKIVKVFDNQPNLVGTFLQKDLELLEEIIEYPEKSTLKIEQIDDDYLNGCLLNAEAKCNEAKKLMSEYLISLKSFEQVKEKIDETLLLYDEIKGQCSPEVQQKISNQIQILNSELRKNLFAYARNQCISSKLINDQSIKTIAEKLCLEGEQLLKYLNSTFNGHLQYIEKNILDNNSKTKPLKKDIKITDITEVRLLTTAVLPELLGQREHAIEGYFRLAHYHSIANERESDKGTTRSLLMNSCLLKAQSLETAQEKKYKENRIHLEFVTFLEKIRNHFSYDTFSCFISYDGLKETEDWVNKYLYKDLITLGIRPIFRRFNQEVGKHEVDYSKTIRDADFVLVLCSATMKEKYENYLRGIKNDYRVGMEMEFLKDRYLSGKDLYNTFHLLMNATWEEIAFSNLPSFFQRKNFINFRQDPSAHYSKNLMYFTESLKLFCDLLKIPENMKANYIDELARKIEEIENHPFALTEKSKVEEFLEKQKVIPALPLLPDRSKNNTRLIEVPNVGKDYQPRKNLSLDTLFKTTNRVVLTQDPTIVCGVGKSYLAAQYVYHFGEKYSQVLWLNGKNETSLQESLSKISESLKNEKVKDKEFFVEWVDNTSLVIFDDVADPQMIASYLPRSFCHILMTSRHFNWSDDWKKVSLKLLTIDEGKQLLARITQKFDDQAAETLAISLGNIPSLISEAGYLLKETHDGPKSYPPILDSEIAAKGRMFSYRAKLFSRPPHFAGRKPYLAAIQEMIFTNFHPIIILQGPPSIGKTSIAHEFAFQNVAKFKRLWHLPCAKDESLENAVREFAMQLGVSTQEQDLSRTLKKIYEVLNTDEGKTLLIFDDLIEEKSHLLPFFPDNIQMNICTLVTTRTVGWESRGAVLPIPPFSQEETYSFLKGILKEDDSYSLSTYVQLFTGNPFALSFVAHCLKASNMNSVDYIKRLTVELGANTSFEKLFSSLWKLTEENLVAYNNPKMLPAIKKQLLPLAKLCACSSNGTIIKKQLQMQMEEALKNEKLDPEENPISLVLRDLVTILREFFILNQTENSVSIHPIIAQAIKSGMTPEEISAYLLKSSKTWTL